MAIIRKAYPNGHSLAVTLPHEWCKANEVFAGSKLILDCINMSVVVSKYYDEEPKKESVLTTPEVPTVEVVEEPRRVYTGERISIVDRVFKEYKRRY